MMKDQFSCDHAWQARGGPLEDAVATCAICGAERPLSSRHEHRFKWDDEAHVYRCGCGVERIDPPDPSRDADADVAARVAVTTRVTALTAAVEILKRRQSTVHEDANDVVDYAAVLEDYLLNGSKT